MCSGRDLAARNCYFYHRNMARGPSPLVGYNTNVRHKGKLYHIQTEDSGVQHPHIITHLFADGGRIIASRKTSYAQHIGQADLQQIVKRLMQEQHKGMFIALRDCEFDEPDADTSDAPEPVPAAQDVEALERAARAREAESAVQSANETNAKTDARYGTTVPAATGLGSQDTSQPSGSIFGGKLVSEKSLDEVILSYLADDIEDGDV